MHGGARSAGAPGRATAELDAFVRLRAAALDPDDERGSFRLLQSIGAGTPAVDAVALREAVDCLQRLALDPTPAVRRGALALLARTDPQAVVEDPFTSAFLDPDADVRLQAVQGRARHGMTLRWSQVVPLARHDPDHRVRAAAARALGSAPSASAGRDLLALLADEEDVVVEAAADALARVLQGPLPTEVLAAAAATRPRVRESAARVLGALHGRDCAAPLVALAADREWTVRRTALGELTHLTDPEGLEMATAKLLYAATDAEGSRTDRMEALQALARLAVDPPAEPLAEVAAQDPDPVLRLIASRTILALGDPRGLPVLVDLLSVRTGPHADEEDRDFVRETAAATLTEVTGVAPAMDDRAPWRRLLPELVARLAPGTFEYAPAKLVEFW